MANKQLLTMLLLLGTTHYAYATHFSGFASIGAGRLNDGDATLGDYSDSWKIRGDTVLGIQLNAPLSTKVALTAQAIVEGYTYEDQDDYEPAIEWLFLSMQTTPTSRFRLGRMRTPLFLYSESLQIGFTYPWVRPPIEVYNPVFVAASELEGIDFTLFNGWRNKEIEIKLAAGQTNGRFLSTYTQGEPTFAASITISDISSTIRYAFLTSSASQYSTSLFALKEAYLATSQALGGVPVITSLAHAFELNDVWVSYHTLGMEWTPSDWTLSAEFNTTESENEGFNPKIYGLYLSLAKQIGPYQPYGIIAYTKVELNSALTNLLAQSYQVLPAGFSPEIDTLRATSQRVAEGVEDAGYSASIGCRWDIRNNAALKVELQYFDRQVDILGGNRLGPKSDTKTLLTTVIVDWIF